MNQDYTINLSPFAEDNQTEITKTLVVFKDCDGFPSPSDGSEFWNCNKCPNDDDYCQPYALRDKIYFQLPYQSGINNYCALPTIYIVENGVKTVVAFPFPGTKGVTSQVGVGEDLLNYVNVVVNTGNSFFNSKSCWYLQIALLYCPTGVTHFFNSDMFCPVGCEEKTLLITGEYPTGTDCNGVYYGGITPIGLPKAASIYVNSMRVRGVVENAGYEFEETVNNGIKVKSKQRESYTLYTKKLPYYVVKQLASKFNSKQLKIDGIAYQGALKLNKNFDEGSMWIIKENLYIDCDEINFTCDL